MCPPVTSALLVPRCPWGQRPVLSRTLGCTRTGTGMVTGTLCPQPAQPQERSVPRPCPLPTCTPSALPVRPCPIKPGWGRRAGPTPCVHRKPRSTLPLLTVNTGTAPGGAERPCPRCAHSGDHHGPLYPPPGPGDTATPASRSAGMPPTRRRGRARVPTGVPEGTWARAELVLVPARCHRRAAQRQPAFSPEWFLSSPQTKPLFILNQRAITGKRPRSPRGTPRRPGDGRLAGPGGGHTHTPGPGHSLCPPPRRLTRPGGAPAARLLPSRS